MTSDQIIDAIIEREGGFVDHPADTGGPTKFGVTAAALADWRGGTMVDATDVEQLSINEARDIYRARYLVKPGLDKVTDDTLRAILLDFAIHSGPAQAIKALQRSLNVAPDGVIGPQTLLALPHLDARKVALRVMAHRVRFQGRLITDKPSQAAFAAGWANRNAELLESLA